MFPQRENLYNGMNGMNDIKKHFLIIGAGISGTGAAGVLLRRGQDVLISDEKAMWDQGQMDRLQGRGARFSFGQQDPSLLTGIDTVIVSPVIPAENPLVQAALKKGIPVISEIELAWRIAKAPILAITGTNGKTTSTTLLGEMIHASGRPGSAAGNIGISLSGTAEAVPENGLIAAEVSSFQLEFIDRFRPRAAVILNITPDHFERHHTMKEYIRVKSRIFENMRQGDRLLLNRRDPVSAGLADKASCDVFFINTEGPEQQGAFLEDGMLKLRIDGRETLLCRESDIHLLGRHNMENCLAAAFLAEAGGIDAGSIAYTLRHFKGLPHRIEFVGTRAGAAYYNDSKATNTDAAVKALEAFKKPVILIAGGHDKQTPLEDFMKTVHLHAKALILIGNASERFAEEARRAGVDPVICAGRMEQAVREAEKLAVPGDTVLLSPACSSYDQYTCYEERGDDFKNIVGHMGTKAEDQP